jgi:hypothetical protein
MRHLGHEGLLLYLEAVEHPLYAQINELLEAEEAPKFSNLLKEDIIPMLQSDANTHQKQDEEAFRHIAGMCNEYGNSAMQALIQEHKLDLNALHGFNMYQKATFLYIQHRTIFDEAETIAEVDQTPNWKVFVGESPTPLKLWDNVKQPLQDAILSTFQQYLNSIRNVLLEAYDLKDRFILEIKTEGDWQVQEQFSPSGEIETLTYRKPIDFALVYYPKEGVLKIKTTASHR